MENRKIARVEDLLAFWTGLMYDKSESLVQRLKASELLAKSYGVFREYVKPEPAGADDKALDKALELLSTEELRKLVYGDDYAG